MRKTIFVWNGTARKWKKEGKMLILQAHMERKFLGFIFLDGKMILNKKNI